MTLLNSNIFDLRKSQHSAGTFINICMKKNRTYTEILISTSYDQRYDLNLKNITNNFDFSSRLFPTKYLLWVLYSKVQTFENVKKRNGRKDLI